MAVQVWDGLDHYNSSTDLAARSGFLQWDLNAQTTYTFVTGRNGTQKALQMNKSSTHPDYISAVLAQRVASAFFGLATYMPTNSNDYIFEMWDSLTNDIQVSVVFRKDNQTIAAYRGMGQVAGHNVGGDTAANNAVNGVLLGITNNNVFSQNSWNFIEIWTDINGSTGFVKVYVNSVLLLNVTGVNTQYSANASWDIMHIEGSSGVPSAPLTIDDFYYGDTTTGAGTFSANTPLGDCHTVTLFPVGNSSVQFTPLTGTNWGEVSEQAMDSDTSYNFDSTVGHEDLLNFGAMPSGVSLIYGIQVTAACRKDDAGSRFLKFGVKSGATETYGSNHSLGEAFYVYFTDQWILDPNTSADWLVAGVNALAAGYNVQA